MKKQIKFILEDLSYQKIFKDYLDVKEVLLTLDTLKIVLEGGITYYYDYTKIVFLELKSY